MTLASFQMALCDLTASPGLCIEVRAGSGDEVFSRYELTERERARLQDVASQPGMSTNCTLYRSNRITPVYTLLHYTCFLLGERLESELEAYWEAEELRDLEFKREIERFAGFVKRRIAEGHLEDPYLEEVLDFEIATNELRFAPRRSILKSAQGGGIGLPADGRLRIHPLVRAVWFHHDPSEVLEALSRGQRPAGLARQESMLILSAREETLTAIDLDAGLARQLLWIQQGRIAECDKGLVEELVRRDLVVLAASAAAAC